MKILKYLTHSVLLALFLSAHASANQPLVDTFDGEATEWAAINGAAATLSGEKAKAGYQSLKVAILFPENEESPKSYHAVLLARSFRALPDGPVAIEVDIAAHWVNEPPTSPTWTHGSWAKPFLAISGRQFGYQEIEARGGDRNREFAPQGNWRTFRFVLPSEVAAALAQDVKDGVEFGLGLGLSAGAWGDSPIASLVDHGSGMVFYYDNFRMLFE